jgi:HEAT repeat protein
MSRLLQIYERLDATDDAEALLDRGRRELRSENPLGALEHLVAALLHTHSREEAYARAVASSADAFAKLGRHREVLSLAWYARNTRAQRTQIDHVPPLDRARTLARWANDDPERASNLHRRAAAELETAGLLVRAAIEYERAGDPNLGRALWSRLALELDLARGEPYAAGLARFNLARTSRALGDERAAREATVESVHRLEEAADRFESMGQRERAFDCYHVLIAIGELTGTFEHVLEGSVNAIRILTEDNLRFHALRLYERSLALAVDAREHAAAATLAREMTAYARKHGVSRFARRGLLREAELWETVADALLERGGPTELAENALLASLLAAAEAGVYRRVGATFERLSQLDLDPARRDHYARARARYTDARDLPAELGDAPEPLGEHIAPPDVWHVDLIEWEERGSAAEACADVLLDPEAESDRVTRRAALVGRLVALEAETQSDAPRASALLANHLASIGLYTLLSPLEALYRSHEPRTRRAAINALSRYFFKRTFVTLEAALRDPDKGVVEAAEQALGRLRFEHAFDPLSRIYRTAPAEAARIAALRALARIDVAEAAELLLAALEHGSSAEQNAAVEALSDARGMKFVEAARAVYPRASQPLRRAIRRVLQSRGLGP